MLRRALVAPLILAVEFGVLVFAPFLAAASAVLSLIFGGRRPIRVLALALAWASTHIASVGACVVLAGAGHREHYGVMRWFVGSVARTALRVARVRVEVRDSAAAEAVLSARETPVLALSIHSGEGDSLLVLDLLLRRHHRNPRIVMHQALALDPLIDMLGNRLPNRFIDPRGGDIEVEIAAMSRDLGAADAVLIFPEGGNFTPERRIASIQRLLKRGHHHQAAQAEAMTNISAPRPGGALAALESAPDADVVFLAHHGFPDGFGQAWRELPERTPILVQMWHVPAGEIPAGTEARIEWLFDWWKRLDAWVGEQRAAQAISTATRA
ncbi:1-acyl-sn-glycerol-3-phosphate acyltransferase [Solirubrobacter soli]|uniref:1-acyl-sn-glycerol-3-phosphate acyltransferase n=1 Tax=Solirubrobacter soli TaxID=363832 RepID=UPI0003F8A518|nr:1-acyl-sn-glycerol-3-phosphate acyltransferase [Solirubrobacter soli]